MRKLSFLVAVVIASSALVGCRTNEATGRLQLSTMSREDEISLGTQAQPQLIAEYGGEVTSAALRNYVAEVGHSMAQLTEGDNPTLPWEFTVLDSDVINAFALPGGKVFISRGLLQEFENEAQLAGVLGHEIGHVTAKHIDERISQSQTLGIGGAIVGAVVGGGTNWGTLIDVVVGVGGQGYLLKFGRDQESEADALGVRYMVAAGYDPIGMVQVIEVLKKASEGPRPIEMLSTHPYPETRLARVSRLIEKEYTFARDNPQFVIGSDRFTQRARPYISAGPGDATQRLAAGGCWCGREHGDFVAVAAVPRPERRASIQPWRIVRPAE